MVAIHSIELDGDEKEELQDEDLGWFFSHLTELLHF
jgi:hypothetical protein